MGKPRKNDHKEYIYVVRFKDAPIDTRKEFFFYCLAAIYDHFTPEQIGAKIERLWGYGIARGKDWTNRNGDVNIRCEPIYRKPKANLKRG